MDNNYDGPVDQPGNAEGHACYLYRVPSGEHRARCACDATWVYGQSRTMEEMISMYESHLKYFTRKKMETL